MSLCPTCGRQRAGDSPFCGGCGHDFREAAAEPGADATRWDRPLDATRWEAPIDATRLERRQPPAASSAAGVPTGVPPEFRESAGPPVQAEPAEPDPFATWFAPEPPAAETTYAMPPPAGTYRAPAPPGPGFPPPPGPAYAGGPAQRSSRGGRAALIIVAVLVVLAAGGGAYKLVSRSNKPSPLASPSAGATRTAQASTSASGSPAASSPASGTPSASGPLSASPSPSLVSVASGVASNPATPQVETVLSHFFQGINTHSYAEYTSALDAPERAKQTQSSFSKGYSTTTDSGMTLTALSSTGSGGLAATVTFTSHQAASSSVDNSACNLWTLTFYLVPQGTGYLDGFAPSGYQPKYSNC